MGSLVEIGYEVALALGMLLVPTMNSMLTELLIPPHPNVRASEISKTVVELVYSLGDCLTC
jgi:hypothetical protein